jgi:hypothetical protein
MPQQAVTNGYEKSEYFLAQARALSNLVVRNPDGSLGIIAKLSAKNNNCACYLFQKPVFANDF